MTKKRGWIASVLRAFNQHSEELTEADVVVVVNVGVRAARAQDATVRLAFSLAFHGAAVGFERPCFDVADPGIEQ